MDVFHFITTLPELLESFVKLLTWPVFLLIVLIMFFKEIKTIIEKIARGELVLKVAGVEIRHPPPQEDIERLSKAGQYFKKQKNESLIELSKLLDKYKYVWANWRLSGTQEKCNEVRFSDAYYGPALRYVDDYSDHFALYMKCYGDKLKSDKELFDTVQELKDYIDHIKVYHHSGQKLNAPVFSIPKYLQLWVKVVQILSGKLET